MSAESRPRSARRSGCEECNVSLPKASAGLACFQLMLACAKREEKRPGMQRRNPIRAMVDVRRGPSHGGERFLIDDMEYAFHQVHAGPGAFGSIAGDSLASMQHDALCPQIALGISVCLCASAVHPRVDVPYVP